MPQSSRAWRLATTSTRGCEIDYPGFIGASYQSQAVTADQEETINWYPERMESQGATTRAALYPTPGVSLLATALTTGGRAHSYENGREFAVIGTAFGELAVDGTLTVRGTVAVNSDPAMISSNGDGGGEIFITSGGNGYIFDRNTSAFTQITNLNGKATMGGAVDGYFLALDAATSKLYISNLLDGLTWDPTQFAQRSVSSDPWKSMKVSGRYVWLFGDQTSEVWYNTGASPFPFAPHPSGFIPYGISAPFSPSVADGSILWLGSSRVGNISVYRAAGFTPDVISSYPMQATINGYPVVLDAVGDTYNDRGHTFYLLTFRAKDVTWCWDFQTNQWTKRGTWIAEENRFSAWRPRWHALAFGQHRWLDADTGSVYMTSINTATDVDGRPLRRVRRAPALTAEHETIYYSSFELDLEPGLGTETGQGADPQVMMRQSRDGGKTWGTEQMRSAGKIGEYLRRVRWNRCGSARRMVFEVSVTDPIPWRLTAAYLGLGQPITGVGRQAAAQ